MGSFPYHRRQITVIIELITEFDVQGAIGMRPVRATVTSAKGLLGYGFAIGFGELPMKANLRRFVRRSLGYRAKIVATDGSWGRNCRVIDVSHGGAKLVTEQPLELPDEFVLALATRGAANRHCHVVWRQDCEIGVEFRSEREGVAQPSAPTRTA